MAKRNSKQREVEEEEDVDDVGCASEDVEIDVTKRSVAVESEECQRKFVIARREGIENSVLTKVRHPSGGVALMRIDEGSCDEILQSGESYRSWFYSETVISDGSIRVFSPIHPLFVGMSYLCLNKENFLEIEEIFKDADVPAVSRLVDNAQLLRSLHLVSDKKDVCGTTVYRFNLEKTLQWVSKKFAALKETLSSTVHKALLDAEDSFNRYVFMVLSDYLCEEVNLLAKAELGIKEADEVEHVDMGMKRRAVEEHEEALGPVIKKPRESRALKELQKASKGTKSISSFFSKK